MASVFDGITRFGRPPVLFGTARSGSSITYLALLAFLRGRFGLEGLGEAFEVDTLLTEKAGAIVRHDVGVQQWRRSLSERIWKQVVRRRLSLLNRYYGRYFFKFFPHQINERIFEDLSRRYDIICIERRNLFDQILSYAVSQETQVWIRFPNDPLTHVPEGSLEARIRYMHFFERTIANYRKWKQWYQPARTIIYEDLPRPLTPQGIVQSAFPSLNVGPLEAHLPEIQNPEQKLRLFKNSKSIVTWYKQSRLQELHPI